jgi:hypothetical protein
MAPDYEAQGFGVDERKTHAQRNNQPGYGRRYTSIKAPPKSIIFAEKIAYKSGCLL